jgi:hypothetical protein
LLPGEEFQKEIKLFSLWTDIGSPVVLQWFYTWMKSTNFSDFLIYNNNNGAVVLGRLPRAFFKVE